MGVGKSGIDKKKQKKKKDRVYNASHGSEYAKRGSQTREQSALKKSGIDDLQKETKEKRGRNSKK